MITEFWQKTDDDLNLYVRKWSDETKQPKAIIQIAHGMIEHIKRYDKFCEFLVERGFYVYGNDHRGHGQTVNHQGILGYLADKDGFIKLTNDLFTITKKIKQEHNDIPVFLFGHSMGSFLVRRYIQNYSMDIDGVILSGTGFHNQSTLIAGKKLAQLLPAKKPSKIMNSLTFGHYNKRITHAKTEFDWLSSDNNSVKLYMKDPLTGYVPTARFFYDLLDGLTTIHKASLNKSIRKDLPILLLSGSEDPVGNYGKGVWKTACFLQKSGLTNITTMLFDGGRHEMLHEKNNEEVYALIYNWMNKNL